jgi:hypothetical protein
MYTAAETAAELRRVADALDKHPDLELSPYLAIHAESDDKETFVALARIMPRPMQKGVDFEGTSYEDFKLEHGFWKIKIPRSVMCVLKAPARAAIYDCPSIFSPEEEAELSQA